MAISAVEFRFLKTARDAGHFAGVKSILEFGETNTQNLDVPAALKALLPQGADLAAALAEADRIFATVRPAEFALARLLYSVVYNGVDYTAVDLEPRPPHVIQQDLNAPSSVAASTSVSITARRSTSLTSLHSTRPSTITRAPAA